MISRKRRLPVQETRGLRPEHSIAAGFLTARVYPGGEENRFGVVISAKAEKRAAKRHYWKRRILDAAAAWQNFGKDIAFIASPRLGTAKREDVDAALRTIHDALVRIYT